jgi:hypothetical protein
MKRGDQLVYDDVIRLNGETLAKVSSRSPLAVRLEIPRRSNVWGMPVVLPVGKFPPDREYEVVDLMQEYGKGKVVK